MRKPHFIGNWKLHKTKKETVDFINTLKQFLESKQDKIAGICPSFVNLDAALHAAKDSNIIIGAQNCHWAESGAFTGEVSIPMLKAINCTYVIVGHSERRNIFGETDFEINRKIKALTKADMHPIFCLGETLDQRNADMVEEVIRFQLEAGLCDINGDALRKIIIAYEPVWAIGTGVTAKPHQAQEVHAFIRKYLGERYDRGLAEETIILYGGSVKPENVKELMAQPDLDGALIGGASLKLESFKAIINY